MRSVGEVLDRHPVWGDSIWVVASAAIGVLIGGFLVTGYRGAFDVFAGMQGGPLVQALFLVPLMAIPSVGSLITLRLITGEAMPRLTVMIVNILVTGMMAHLLIPSF